MPTLTWEKDELTIDKEYRIDINGGHSKLFINNANRKDEGWFTCTAINSAGTTLTRTKVTVLRMFFISIKFLFFIIYYLISYF
jgi:hypothetical protein